MILRLGLAMVGTAMLLHSRSVKAAEEEKTEGEDPDATPVAPGTKYPTTPTLDPAITMNPLLIGPAGARGELPPYDPFNPLGSGFSQPGFGLGPGVGTMPDYVGGSPFQPTATGVSAAWRNYQMIVGLIPASIAQKIRNVKSLADVQARTASKAVSFHKRLLKKIF